MANEDFQQKKNSINRIFFQPKRVPSKEEGQRGGGRERERGGGRTKEMEEYPMGKRRQ